MHARFNFDPPANRDERIERAHETLDFCAAIYQIHAQTGDGWASELLVLKAMQRAALSAIHEDPHYWEWQ